MIEIIPDKNTFLLQMILFIIRLNNTSLKNIQSFKITIIKYIKKKKVVIFIFLI
jgi:hypothetical protein